MSIVFRWSVWGNKYRIAKMLRFSVGTFRRAFRNEARYVICTDEPAEMKAVLGDDVEVLSHGAPGTTAFNVEGAATWKKWCPTPRVSPNSTEFYVDSDVFLVGDPMELRRFSMDTSARCYLVMQEPEGSPYYVGRFRERIFRGIPPINTGFVGQRAGTDITEELAEEVRWWLAHVPAHEREYHDDQGAVVAILARRFLLGQVELLPRDRYCIVNHRSNAHLKTLDGIAAIHATMGHSAFKRFQTEIEKSSL